MPSFYFKRLLLVFACLLFIGGPVLRAFDGPASFTINLPFQDNAATPVWLGRPIMPPTNFATLNVPIIPPDPNVSLLVTVLFQEKQGGFLRISWQGAQNTQLLSDNFYEGIAMRNQRTLLVSALTLQGPGTLNFQCGDTTLSIQRIKLEWVENQTSLVSPQVQNLLVTPASGQTQTAQSLDGQSQLAEPAAWHDEIVNVPITDTAERIEQGVEFNVQIDNVPSSSRIALKESGLAFGKHLVVWINQQRAGTITPAVPDLLDDGYLGSSSIANVYIGWREGSFSVPVALFKMGGNAVQFSIEDDIASSNGTPADSATTSPAPLAVKNVILQLDYPPTPPLSQTSLAPTGPVTLPTIPATPTEANTP